MEKEKLSNLLEGMVGRRVLLLGEKTREDVPRSMYLPFILLINIIAHLHANKNDRSDYFESILVTSILKLTFFHFYTPGILPIRNEYTLSPIDPACCCNMFFSLQPVPQ